MSRRLPSPIALRAFEAAARHLSFTRAAEELGVTQAAISHQVKALEQQLNLQLFRRLTRRLVLTAEGRTLFATLSDAFDRIAETTNTLRAESETGTLEVSLSPYFSAVWLSPRIGRFWHRHPSIDLRLHHSIEPVDFDTSEADLAVLWGQGDWPGLICDHLIQTRLTPVCSPALTKGRGGLRRLEDLHRHTLLRDGEWPGWELWFSAAGLTNPKRHGGSTFDDHNVVLQAAIEGQGVALSDVDLLRAYVSTGRLVQPFKLEVDIGVAYYVIYPPEAIQRPKVRAFRDWLLSEARQPEETLTVIS